MRAFLLAVLAGCAAPMAAAPEPDPDPMPSAVLDHQDPAADTSSHPATYVGGRGASWMPEGCHRNAEPTRGRQYIRGCDAGDASGAGTIGLVVLALRRRRYTGAPWAWWSSSGRRARARRGSRSSSPP